ncbi:MAG: hypothetical protein Q9171_003776 [Xanthocarpia ochracea]
MGQTASKILQCGRNGPPQTFPFEKLPAELQLMVIRFAMPPNGLYLRPGLTGSTHKREQVPVSLFRTSKSMSAMASQIFYNELHLHIGLFSSATWYMMGKPDIRNPRPRYIWNPVYHLPSQLQIQESHQYRRIRYCHINFTLEGISFAEDISMEECRTRFKISKARLRLICDALAHNHSIQRLIVTIPCLCRHRENYICSAFAPEVPLIMDLDPQGPLSQSYRWFLDFLPLLARIKAAEPITFEAVDEDKINKLQTSKGPSNPCERPECKVLAQSFQQLLRRLDGMEDPYEA